MLNHLPAYHRTVAASLILTALLLTGCEGEGRNGAATSSTLRFASAAEVKSLDPHLIHDLTSIRIAEALCDRLLLHNPQTLGLDPGIAHRHEQSEDGLRYTFHLREDARWSDGQPITAEDFVVAWRRALLPDTASYYAALLFPIAGAQDFYLWRQAQLADYGAQASRDKTQARAQSLYDEAVARFHETVGIAALDPTTLQVTLAQSTPYFLQLVAFITFAPMPAEAIESWQRIEPASGRVSIPESTIQTWMKTQASGAYVLDAWRFRQRIELKANDHYWNRAAMGNDRIIQHVIESPQTQLLRYRRGDLDWLPDIPTASPLAADLLAQQRSDVHDQPAAGTYYYLFNCQQTIHGQPNPLADPRVRKALSLTIDRTQIVEQVTRVHQPVARTMTPVGVIPGYHPPVDEGPTYDPDRARTLLAEAGYPGGQGLEGLSILYNTEGAHEAVAQVIRRTWERELGVRVGLEGMEWGRLLDRRQRGDYTIMRAGWFGDYQDPTSFLDLFLAENPSNDSHYQNPAYDELYTQAQQTSDPAARFELLRQAEAILMRDAPLAPIYQYTTLDVFDPDKVHGLYPNPWKYRRLEQIRLGADPAALSTDEMP